MDAIAVPPHPPRVPIATLAAHALGIRHRDPASARELAARAEAAALASGEAAEVRRARAALGACLSIGSEYLARGRALLRDVLAACEAAGDRALACEVMNELAAGYVSTGEHDAANRLLGDALAAARALGRRGEEARALRLMGSTLSDTGEFSRALALLLEALRVHEALRGERPAALDDAAHWERGSLFGRIGVVYSNLDQFAQAISYYEAALESFAGRFPHRAARIHYRMGIAAEELGELDRAEAFYRDAFRLHDEHGHRAGRAVALMGMGNVLGMRGALDAAEAALREAMAEMEDDPVHASHFADALWMMADVHLRRGEPAEALALLERALPLYHAFGRPASHEAGLHLRLHRARRALGDHALALEHHERYHALTVRHLEERSSSRVAEMMARFDTERALKDRELSRLRSAALEQEIAERRQVEAELARAKAELEARNRELQEISIRDPLTGLFNRRHLDERLGDAFALAVRKRQPLAVMICDLDDFKRINDTFSHAVGDAVLRALGDVLRENLRRSDVAARFGGEEFVVLFPGSTLAEARAACEKLRRRVEGHDWAAVHPELAVTISAGVAAAEGHANHEKLLAEADRRLYEAKRRGKNRVRG